MVPTFGKRVKAKRLEFRLTLKEFCNKNDLDVVQVSQIEREVIDPNLISDALIERLGSALYTDKAWLMAGGFNRVPKMLVDRLPAFLPLHVNLESFLKYIKNNP